MEKTQTPKIKYYSEKGQDKWLAHEVYKLKRNGYFVEVGAGNGRKNSNTLWLEEHLDWKGICVEPNPEFKDALNKKRKCIIDHSLVFSESGKIVNFSQRGYFSGIEGHINKRSEHFADVTNQSKETIQKTTSTLEEILDKHKAPRFIDVLTIDTEGSEPEILKVFPFSRYAFGVIIVEVSPETEDKIYNILEPMGYILKNKFKNDFTFLNKNLAYIYDREHNLEYYGNDGQDKWVAEEIFGGQYYSGYFVEVGAGDGSIKSGSNTLALEKYFNWRGICIDGDRKSCKFAKKNRVSTVVNAVVDKIKRTVDFTKKRMGKDGIIEYSDNQEGKTEKRKTELLIDILKKWDDTRFIQFLSLDVEGAEVPILETFPFDEYKFGTIVVDYDQDEEKIKNIKNILEANGYEFVKKGKHDLFFIEKRLKRSIM